jgi:hypothetical protein
VILLKQEFSTDDNNEFYTDETQLQLAEKRKMAVPGLVAGAHDVNADGMDD